MSDQTATVGLVLDLKAKLDEVKAAQKELLQLAQTGKDASEVLSSVAGGFTQGLGIGGALGVLQIIEATISETVGAMKDLVAEGVNLNKELESSQIGIAGALRNFFPEKYQSFNDALEASGQVIDLLKQKSAAFGLSFTSLADQYRATVGAMLKGGVTDIQKQIDLTVLLNRTLSTFNITGARATRDIIDLLNGSANRTVVAKELGVTDAQIKNAKEGGQIFEFFTEKLKGFSEAQIAAANTTGALEQRLANAKAIVAAEETQELTAAYKDLLKALTDLVNSDGFRQFTAGLAKIAEVSVGKLQEIVQAITANDPNKVFATTTQSLSTDLANANSNQALDAVRKQALTLRESISGALSQDNQSSELFKSSEYGKQLLADYHAQLDTINQIIEATDKNREQIIAQAQATQQKNEQSAAAARIRISEQEAGAELDKNASKTAKLTEEELLFCAAGQERLDVLRQIVTETDAEYDAKLKTATGPNQQALIELQRKQALLPLLTQILALQKQISNEAEKQSKSVDKELESFFKGVEQESARLEIERAKSALSDIDALKADVKADQYINDEQKETILIQLLNDEAVAIQKTVDALRVKAALTQGEAAKNSLLKEADSLAGRGKKLGAEQERLKPETFGQTLVSSIVQVENQLGTTMQNVGNVIRSGIGSAVQGISTGIYGWITGTKTWAQSLAQIGSSVLQSIIQGLINIGVRQLLIHTVGTTLQATTAATTLAEGAAVASGLSALLIAPATLATIASYGTAAALAPGELAASLAASAPLALFKSGGYTGDGDPNQLAGGVHYGEFVIPADRVRDIGLSRLSSLAFGSNGGVRTGGVSTAQAAPAQAASQQQQSQRPLNIINHFDTAAVRKEIQNSEGETWVLGVFQNNRHLFT